MSIDTGRRYRSARPDSNGPPTMAERMVSPLVNAVSDADSVSATARPQDAHNPRGKR